MNAKISIGLPVYNGEDYLADAVLSILAQTYDDFELVICDNASSDGTERISREFAAADPRVRYVRNEKNLGACPNFNRAFELCDSEYFKWAAHDDLLSPHYLAKCMAALEEHPEAVMCYTDVSVIDENGVEVTRERDQHPGTVEDSPSRRFSSVIMPARINDSAIFGVYRSRFLKDSPLLRSYNGSDRLLVAIMAMQGQFVHVPEPLFLNRHHDQRISFDKTVEKIQTRMDAKNAGRKTYPLWRLYADYFGAVNSSVSSRAERLRCFGHLARWWFVNFNCMRMLIDFLAAYDQRFLILASKAKHRLLGPAAEFVRAKPARP